MIDKWQEWADSVDALDSGRPEAAGSGVELEAASPQDSWLKLRLTEMVFGMADILL